MELLLGPRRARHQLARRPERRDADLPSGSDLLRWVPLAALAGALLATFPLVAAPTTDLLGYPSAENVDHAWALWAALRDGPLVIDTTLVNHPAGIRWVLADPLNLIWFAPASLLGPVAAFNAVQLGNLWLAGVAAAVVWRVVFRGDPDGALFCAGVAPCLPVLAGGLFTGMTEAQTVGWLGLALAALWWALEAPSWRRTVLAGVALGACAWAGVYTAIYAGMAATVLAAARWRSVRVWGPAAGIGLALAAPIAWATSLRPSELPGGMSHAGLVASAPSDPKNLALSGDLLGLVWPFATHGVFPPGATDGLPFTHAAYLGLAMAALAVVGTWRAPRAWLAAAAVLLVAGLGYQLQVGGQVVPFGDARLVMPAGLASEHLPVIGRASRWYRAHLATGLLLVPVAALGVQVLARGRRWPWAVAALLVVGDQVFSGALPFPRATSPATLPAVLSAVDGPIVHVDDRPPSPDRLRNRSLMWQMWTGVPLVENPLGASTSDTRDVDAWLVLPEDARSARATRHELGEPDLVGDGLLVWKPR